MYALIVNNAVAQYPYSAAKLRLDNPGTSFARDLPNERLAEWGVFPVTPVSPPAAGANQSFVEGTPVFTNGAWTQTWVSVTLDGAGIQAKRDQQIAAIKAARDLRSVTGGYQVAGNWFHSDLFSRSQQIGLLLLGNNIPAGLEWKTMGGTKVPMTPTLAQQVFAAAAASDQALFAYGETLIAAVNAATDPMTVNITTGWPVGFGG